MAWGFRVEDLNFGGEGFELALRADLTVLGRASVLYGLQRVMKEASGICPETGLPMSRKMSDSFVFVAAGMWHDLPITCPAMKMSIRKSSCALIP